MNIKEFVIAKTKSIKDDLLKIHKSMTIWFNGLMLTLMEVIPFAQDQFPQLQAYVSPNFYKHAMIALVVGNIILRFKTNSKLSNK